MEKKSIIQCNYMNTIAMCHDSTMEIAKRNPDCCRIVIGMNTKTEIFHQGRIKHKFDTASFIIKKTKRCYLTLIKHKIFCEALMRSKAKPGSS